MRRRRKGSSNPSLDLHDTRHHDVDRMVENHIFMTPYPHEIITGNSMEMQEIVISVLDRHKFKYQLGDINNRGYITVLGY